mgnify:CR=1 FL=1
MKKKTLGDKISFKDGSWSFNNFSISNSKNIENNWDIINLDSNNNLLSVKNKRNKILCLMWHPERDNTDSKFIHSFLK